MKIIKADYAQFKWDRECSLAQKFLKQLGIAPDHGPEQRERPDFRFTIEGTEIGLELTQYFFPSTNPDFPYYLSSLQNQAVYEAWQEFRSSGGQPLYVAFEFSENRTCCGPRTRKEKVELADELCAIVTQIIGRWGVPQAGQSWGIDLSSEASKNDLLQAVDRLWVEPSLNGVDELWSVPRATMGIHIPPDYVQGCLNRKSLKYHSYAHGFQQVWLLIVNDWPMQHAACRISEGARSAVYTFPFDRAFWWDLDADLTELQNGSFLQKGYQSRNAIS